MQFHHPNVYVVSMKTSDDPDQLASLEASCSGSALLSEEGIDFF